MELDHDDTLATLRSIERVHVIGAGLKSGTPAFNAVHDISKMGWSPIPVHPRDAGGTIAGYPIRPLIDEGIEPDIIVLFLAPLTARALLRKLIMSNSAPPSLIWFQNGAEDDISEGWLNQAGWPYVKHDCIVRFMERNDLSREPNPVPWFRQVRDERESGCSIWTVHEYREHSAPPQSKLEWVGDLFELESSNALIPRYVRGLMGRNESLEQCGRRLAD